MAQFRVLLLINASTADDAKAKAGLAAKASGGSVDKIQTRRESWGTLGEAVAAE